MWSALYLYINTIYRYITCVQHVCVDNHVYKDHMKQLQMYLCISTYLFNPRHFLLDPQTQEIIIVKEHQPGQMAKLGGDDRQAVWCRAPAHQAHCRPQGRGPG